MRRHATARPGCWRAIFFHTCARCATPGAIAIKPAEVIFRGIDEARLVSVARSLAPSLGAGGVIHLAGPLGAGKTTFARSLLVAMGVAGRIKSPTYTLVESYVVGELTAHHLDLYRIAAADEIEWLGLDDLAGGDQLWLIEWPERAAGAVPAPDLIVDLAHAGSARDLRLISASIAGARWLDDLSQQQLRADT